MQPATPSAPSPEPSRRASPRPPTVLVAVCLLVLVQAAALIGMGIAWTIDLIGGRSELPSATGYLVLFTLALAALLITGVRGLWRGRRWPRGPVFTWELLLFFLAINWVFADVAAWELAAMASTVLVITGLLLPSVVAATAGSRSTPALDGNVPLD